MTNFEQWLKAANEVTTTSAVALKDQPLGGKKKKKNENIYDGRTREAKKFVERMLAKRAAREEAKKNAK